MSDNATALQGYGYVSDSDETLKSKTGGKFGLNTGFIAKFAYNANVAKEGQPAREAIEIEVHIGDSKYQDWISPITKVYGKNSVELTDTTSPEYIANFNDLMKQQNAIVVHYVKALGVNEEALKATLLASPVTSFADYARRICSLLPLDYNKKMVDVFLEYQWNFGKKQDGTLNNKTFPTLPGNMKGGYFVVGHVPGVFTENRDGGDLKYINQNGQEHPFFRSANFMESKKGFQQVEGQEDPKPANTAFTPGDGAAQASTWGAPPAAQ